MAPYVLTEDENRLEGAPGTLLYVRGLADEAYCSCASCYSLYRKGRCYIHPITKECLGYEADKIGTAKLEVLGDPAVFKVISATDAIERGARLLPSMPMIQPTLIPRPAHGTEE